MSPRILGRICFICVINAYGIQRREIDPSMRNAGAGKTTQSGKCLLRKQEVLSSHFYPLCEG